MSQRILVSFLLLVSILASNCSVQWRNLTEITYKFTTCNASGRIGPTFNDCMNYYRSINSPLTFNGVLNNGPEVLGFLGGQGFKFPRSGMYNVTVAGAAGGRGLCNTEISFGAVLKGQLVIKEGINDTVLILVGQKGVGPCDTNPNYEICESPPENLTKANECLEKWMNVSSSLIYQSLGGGGGGGASMIWPTNSSGHYDKSVFPYLLAGGGGGTSLEINYSAIFNPAIRYFIPNDNITDVILENETKEEFYQRWINARPTDNDAANLNGMFRGHIGNRPKINDVNSMAVSGAGAGWNLTFYVFSKVNGNPLSRSDNFSIGGLDCIKGFGFNETDLPFQNIDGGFGGGGGGCSEGGGGGGFGGGSVIQAGPTIPGGGGYSLINYDTDGEAIGWNDGDGYVEIIPTDCGCVHKCIVNHADMMYQCECPSSTVLASNGIDCITRKSGPDILNSTQDRSTFIVSDTPFSATLVRLSSLFTVYSVSLSFSLEDDSHVVKRQLNSQENEDITCTVVWLNENLVPVMMSGSVNGSLLRIIYNASTGEPFLSDPLLSLNTGLIISSGILLSPGNCTIINITMSISISTGPIVNKIDLESILNTYNSTFELIGKLNIMPDMSNSTTSTVVIVPSASTSTIVIVPSSTLHSSSPTSNITSTTNFIIIIIPAAVGSTVFIVSIVLLFIILTVCITRRNKSKSLRRVYQIHTKGSIDELSGADKNHSNQLQKLRYKLASLRSNPNYGQPTKLEQSLDETDFGNKRKGELVSSIAIENIEHGYSAMKFDDEIKSEKSKSDSIERRAAPHRIRSRSNRRSYTLRPKFGIMGPSVEFFEYNKDRMEDDWEYDRTQLTYLREIGEGQFGKVLLMKARNIAGYRGKLPVAVKTLTSVEEEEIKKFLEEIDLMKRFANPNIVSLLGVNCQYSEGAPLMILEYMPYGDLQSFLVKHRPKPSNPTLIGIYHQIRFAGDIANALNFLESQKYVHRDVAARNCLVGPSLEVKVADFGMARGVQEKEYYRIAGRAVLPVRWMAPESLLYGIFTSASDVWSYGVLLWEIATYGDLPLESCKVQEVVEMAEQKTLTHPWPLNGPEELMEIKEQCHNYEVEKRPKFEEICKILPSSRS